MTKPIAQWSRNGMHQIIGTANKTFNRQTSAIISGNHSGNTHFGNYVRGRLATECNGFSNPLGHLRDFDLKLFKEIFCIPRHVLDKVLEVTESRGEEDSVILYVLFHRLKGYGAGGYRRRKIHGWVLTENHDRGHRLIAKFYSNYGEKTINVVNTCLPFMVEDVA